jgi:hypothetical protein
MNAPLRKRHGPAPRLPSIEAQTIAFVEESRKRPGNSQTRRLRWQGFRAYLRFWRDYPLGHLTLREAVVIASVGVPPAYEGRGWFWRYCQLCLALTNDALVLEEVLHPGLYAALKRRPQFVEVVPRTFVIRKSKPGDWPLNLGDRSNPA